MRFLVVGPGAMGCLFAARLKKSGQHVTLLDYRQERAERISRAGVRVEGIGGEFTVPVEAAVGRISGRPDVVLMCVKANQTAGAARELSGWLGRDALLVTLQNGLGNVEALETVFGRDRVVGGVTAEGATLVDTAHIRHAGRGDTAIGTHPPVEKTVAALVEALRKAGFQARAAENAHELIWGKLVVNVGINALTAITGLRNGRLPEVEGTRAVLEEAVREAASIASAKGINLPYPDPVERVLEVCRATAENIASMLQDVMKKRTTEIAFINGAVVREGKAAGIATPVNRTLTHLVEALQETYEERLFPTPKGDGQ